MGGESLFGFQMNLAIKFPFFVSLLGAEVRVTSEAAGEARSLICR